MYIYITHLLCIFTSSTDTKIRKGRELVRLHWKSSENAYVAGHIFISKPSMCVKMYLYTQVYLYTETLKLYYFCNVTDYRYGVSILVCVWQSSSMLSRMDKWSSGVTFLVRSQFLRIIVRFNLCLSCFLLPSFVTLRVLTILLLACFKIVLLHCAFILLGLEDLGNMLFF